MFFIKKISKELKKAKMKSLQVWTQNLIYTLI